MKKRFIIFVFPLIFVLVSEGISLEKEYMLTQWVQHFVEEKTSDTDEILKEIAAASDIQGNIIPQASMYCTENMVADLEYICSAPRSRTPFVNTVESCGKIYACDFAIGGNVIAYGGVTGYWAEKTYNIEQFSEYTPEELLSTEFYEEWRQKRRDEIVTLAFYHEPEETLPTTPEGIKNAICSQPLDIPFFDQHFLKIWNMYAKERAETHYRNYTEHIAEDDLIQVSVDLYELYGIWAVQNIIQNVDFSQFVTFKSLFFREVFVLLLLSVAGTVLFSVILYHREHSAALSGIPFGALAACFSPSYVILPFFFATGFFSVFYYKMCNGILNKGILLSLETAFIFFLAYYVVNAVVNLYVAQEIQELTMLATGAGRYLGGVAVHFALLLLLATGGGLVATTILRVKNQPQE